MKKKITQMFALAALFLLSSGNVMGQYHTITDAEEFQFTKTNIDASDWVSYSVTNYSDRSRCFTGSVPNMSAAARYLTINVTGCERFTLYVEGNGSRKIDVSIDGGTATSHVGASNTCSSFDFQTNNTGNCVIKVLGNDGSVYVSSMVFYAPSCTEAAFSYPAEEVEISETETLTALTLTNTQNLANVTYTSSNTEVVTVNATTGALTKIGVGESIITASAPRQDVGATTYCAAEASYTVKIKSTSPVLESTTANLDMVLGKFAITDTVKFTISGYNLAGATSISTLPAGFVITPSTFAIEGDGTLEQEFELVYNADAAVADNNATLTFTVGATSTNIAIAYGKEAQTTWTSISDATTWDFNGQIATQTDLTDATIPAQNQVMILADFPGIAPKSDFNAAALKVRGQRLATTFWQGDSLTFNVAQSGTIEVTFSNTGTRSNEYERRYLSVQGAVFGSDDTSNGSSGTNDASKVTVTEVPVTAGEVVIYGAMAGSEGTSWNIAQYLRYYKIVYTPGSLTSIENAETSTKEVASESFYTLSGTQIQEVNNSGIYLKKITYKDGSVETVKFIK